MNAARFVAAAVLAWVAVFGVPSLPAPSQPSETVAIEKPSEAMLAKVGDVQRILRNANPVDRALWAQVWQKSAITVAGDATDSEVVFTDTRSLRAFEIVAVRIAWRRLGGNAQEKYPGLGEAVERAFADAIGLDVKPVTPEVRQAYIGLCNALAWCGAGRG